VTKQKIELAYSLARERFAECGVNTDMVLLQLDDVPISIQCWQGDDVLGFERADSALSGGIQTTGSYPGRATNAEELRRDLELAFTLIPGKKRVNLHAIYLEADKPVDRNEIESRHFRRWVDWAKDSQVGLDFNPTFFSHPKSAQNLTLSHPDKGIRQFWIDHCIASRRISEYIGRELCSPVIMNIWVPDGYKDNPADRMSPRQHLIELLDESLAALGGKHHKIAVEGKLFGIGAESYTVGSNEFYLAYAASRKTLLCIDSGHFHPTENVADKISTSLCYVDEILLHVSRPVRWDSDHVVLLDDSTVGIAQEIVRSNGLKRVHIGQDYFDASINRVAAWVIGTRSFRKALLFAMLEPREEFFLAERSFDYTTRLALMEESKSLPWSAVWDYYCLTSGVPEGRHWLDIVRRYERDVLSNRGSTTIFA
jgi:L-rhamnose isomerase